MSYPNKPPSDKEEFQLSALVIFGFAVIMLGTLLLSLWVARVVKFNTWVVDDYFIFAIACFGAYCIYVGLVKTLARIRMYTSKQNLASDVPTILKDLSIYLLKGLGLLCSVLFLMVLAVESYQDWSLAFSLSSSLFAVLLYMAITMPFRDNEMAKFKQDILNKKGWFYFISRIFGLFYSLFTIFIGCCFFYVTLFYIIHVGISLINTCGLIMAVFLVFGGIKMLILWFRGKPVLIR